MELINPLPIESDDNQEAAETKEMELVMPPELEQAAAAPYGTAVIKVLGIGGGGCNAVNRMYREKIPGVEYYGINTDAQHLFRCEIPHRVAIGQNMTRGLGVGGHPELGRQAAEESRDELKKLVSGADMLFLAAGMGGGTGTGAIPLIAQLAKESGALTVAVVSKPFAFEVSARRKNADDGLARLKDFVDTMIVIPNDRLLDLGRENQENFTWQDALHMADSVLHQGIQSIAEVVTVPGEINVDFADVKSILHDAGPAWLAMGKGKGEHRAIEAAKQASKSPLLDIAIEGAKRILFVITGGNNLTLREVQQAADVIQDLADPEANIIFGTARDPKLDDEVKITLVAASFPVFPDGAAERDENLEKLLRDVLPEEEELDVPSFIRRGENQRKRRGFFR
jgi:cell division protein FtsZ